MLKQPDVVLAQVLLGQHFSMAEKKRNFDYYDPLTTGDSSLSPCIQSVAAAELGYADKAYEYFSRTARMDLDDVNGNVQDGVHTAAMAGTWISIVHGFAGMRDNDGRFPFPRGFPGVETSALPPAAPGTDPAGKSKPRDRGHVPAASRVSRSPFPIGAARSARTGTPGSPWVSTRCWNA